MHRPRPLRRRTKATRRLRFARVIITGVGVLMATGGRSQLSAMTTALRVSAGTAALAAKAATAVSNNSNSNSSPATWAPIATIIIITVRGADSRTKAA
ncbi:MAG: hypothetical protein JWO94_404 [Verrucomicrobiaceae bacterium]|nr:hypothetical protein [Verrucomicrobiaceae bacterium]